MRFLTLLLTALLVPLVAAKTDESRRLSPEHVRILPIGDEAPLLDFSRTILDEPGAEVIADTLQSIKERRV